MSKNIISASQNMINKKKNLENTYKKSYKNFYYSIKHRNSNQKPQWGPCRITKIKKKLHYNKKKPK